MKRTLYLKPALKRLDQINDMVWFHRFNGHELSKVVGKLSQVDRSKLTSDHFSPNPFAARWNTRLEDYDEMRARV